MPDLSFTPAGHWLLPAGLAAVLLALLLVGPASSRTTPKRKLALSALRLVVFALVLLAMLRPTLVYTSHKQQQATLVILFDRSRSMLVKDAFGNSSRYQAMQTTLRDALPALRDLSEDLELKVYSFDSQAQEVDFDMLEQQLAAEPTGEETALGFVLAELLRRENGKRLAGVMLFSDGAVRANAPRDLPPQVPAGQMRDLGYKLFTICYGQDRGPGQARDVAVRDLAASQTVFVKNQLVAGGTVRVQGFVNQQLPVQLLFETSPGKMELVGSKPLQTSVDGQQLPYELTHIPEVPGEFKLTVRAAPQPGELVTTNNEISTFVTVLKGGLNVLYLEGTFRDEMTFLRRSLDASPDIQVDFLRLDANKPGTRPNDLAERFQPGKYDVYILGDLDATAFQPEELKLLAQAVDRGAGLIALGGTHSFGPGGYADTPLADILPVQMEKIDRQLFNQPVRSDMHWPGPVRMKPPARAGGDYIMQLGGQDNRQVWDQLPPLDGANRFRKLKPAAHVLAEGEPGQFLLVSQEAGNGRVLAFAGDTTWRWCMAGHMAEHKRFWRQVVLWLARKDQANDGNVWIKLDQRRFAPGGRVEFLAGARSPQGDPLPGAKFKAEVTFPDGTRRPLTLSRQQEHSTGSFRETQQAGDYTIEVTASEGGVSLGTARARFLVFEQDLELDNSAAEPRLLANLAETTTGRAVAPEQVPALLEELKKLPQQLQIPTLEKFTLWDSWWLFLTLLATISLEWFLRKRWGLV